MVFMMIPAITSIVSAAFLLISITYILWPFIPADEQRIKLYQEWGNNGAIRVVSEKVPVVEQIAVLADLGYGVNPEMAESFDNHLYGVEGGWRKDVSVRGSQSQKSSFPDCPSLLRSTN